MPNKLSHPLRFHFLHANLKDFPLYLGTIARKILNALLQLSLTSFYATQVPDLLFSKFSFINCNHCFLSYRLPESASQKRKLRLNNGSRLSLVNASHPVFVMRMLSAMASFCVNWWTSWRLEASRKSMFLVEIIKWWIISASKLKKLVDLYIIYMYTLFFLREKTNVVYKYY